MGKDILQAVRADIRELSAYPVADLSADWIKLDAMELPYRFPEEMAAELADELAAAPLNLYPNPATCGLQTALRQAFGIPDEAQIALGNGSDELIQLLSMLTAQKGSKMLAVEPSFVMYKHNAALYGMEYIGVPLNGDFSMNLPAVLAAVKELRPALVFLAYPNNPTGVRFAREEIEAVLEAADGIVVVDEAYGSFSSDSFLNLAGSCENLVVMRTLSKIGFAGLRLGYACGHPKLMNELAKITPPYNMNRLSLTAAEFALKHREWIEEKTALLKNERFRLSAAFAALPGVQPFPSEANFLTVRVADAEKVFSALKQANILIKKLHGSHPLLEQCLRFTIGTPEQNDKVLAVVRSVSL
ncbi:MAG: histidinol-phosphate transaminase [Neisseria sp.]|nr:histidinol-phosphate transaminase [Neisseria sp.]